MIMPEPTDADIKNTIPNTIPYCQTLGQGPDLVLIHGWGMHGGIWQGIVTPLSQHFRLHIVDLPGFGYSHRQNLPETITDLTARVLAAAPAQAHYMGWSLGGSVALAIAAKAPERVLSFTSVASNPKFTADAHWPHGMSDRVLGNFSALLQRDHKATIKRFIAIQSMGAPGQKEQLKQVQARVFERGIPDIHTLSQGLKYLTTLDLRDTLAQLTCPCHAIFGRLDALVPVQCSDAVKALQPNLSVRIFNRSSHAPFLSEPAAFMEDVRQFIERVQ